MEWQWQLFAGRWWLHDLSTRQDWVSVVRYKDEQCWVAELVSMNPVPSEIFRSSDLEECMAVAAAMVRTI